MGEIEVELHSTDPAAVQATADTIAGLPGGGVLFRRKEDDRWFITCRDPGFMAFAVAKQGYVKRVIKEDKADG